MNKTTFTEDLENNRLIAVRTFEAPVEKVWKAWTRADLLCQWWAPAPYVCEIQKMDFKEGGFWMYTMTGPEGDVYRGRMDYLKIVEFERMEGEDFFCDEEGNKAGDIPPMLLTVTFESEGTSTVVTTTTTFASAEAFKQMAEMGAAEGWELSLNQQEELLNSLDI